jgi:excisionase family DNA binding protein
MKIWLNVSEGAEYAGVPRDTIYTACERGELHHIRIAAGARFV